MPRVLIGAFGMIAGLGLRELLHEGGLEVVGISPDGPTLFPRLSETRPDAVVLDLDGDDTDALATRIASTFPAIKVIACSAAQPVMRVFPPFHHGESYVSPLSTALLVTALET